MAINLDYPGLLRQLRQLLLLHGPADSLELRERLGVSQPVFSRLYRSAESEVLRLGKGRKSIYALLRPLPELAQPMPVHRVDESGQAHRVGQLLALQPEGFFFDADEPGPGAGLFSDLPYFLQDMRPQGFLGRLISKRLPELGLPENPGDWSASQLLRFLCVHGWSMPGQLILGRRAFERHLQQALRRSDGVEREEREKIYPRMAEDVLQYGLPGSSAGGEQPKFLCLRLPDAQDVLVKFSPPGDESVARRMADLLVAEHVALRTLRDHGQDAARSELVTASGRSFLEVERFDRSLSGGRRGLLSLEVLVAEFGGRLDNWILAAIHLVDGGHVPREALDAVRFRACFGRLIANTDMHVGNLSFFSSGSTVQGLAPAYDMLPMLYAPRAGHLMEQSFEPHAPRMEEVPVFEAALKAAIDYWHRLGDDKRLSEDFRAIARSNREKLKPLLKLVPRLPRKGSDTGT